MFGLLKMLPLLLPLCHVLALVTTGTQTRWATSQTLSAVGLVASLLGAIAWFAFSADAGLADTLIAGNASIVLSVLIGFLGLVVVRFSHHYLRGEAQQGRYLAMLHVALAAISTTILTDHLAVLLIGWAVISLALHELLLFYPNRQRAIIAARKKFIFARLAELALFAAILLLVNEHNTWSIREIVSAYPAPLSSAEHAAIMLMVIAALVKCAQIPAHGWLIQVVEAPTPVSALLHAGIINLGGYLLIVFGPLLTSSAPAQWLLLVIAGGSLLMASLIMLNQHSVKVKLAWSTVAQMALMLVECGLGLYELALLHLLAHACYKAYLFLRAGSRVQRFIDRQWSAAPATSTFGHIASLLVALALCGLTALVLTPQGPFSPWLLLALVITPLLAKRNSRIASTLIALALILAYSIQKWTMSGIVETLMLQQTHSGWGDLWISGIIVLLCASQAHLSRQQSTQSRTGLTHALLAGLYLDEWVTRTTLKVWPLKRSSTSITSSSNTLAVEAD